MSVTTAINIPPPGPGARLLAAEADYRQKSETAGSIAMKAGTVVLMSSMLALSIMFGLKHKTLHECKSEAPPVADATWLSTADTVAIFEMYVFISSFVLYAIISWMFMEKYKKVAKPMPPVDPGLLIINLLVMFITCMAAGPFVIMKELFDQTATCPSSYKLDKINLFAVFLGLGAASSTFLVYYGHMLLKDYKQNSR